MRPQRLQVGRERGVGAEQRLDRHRGGDVGRPQQRAQVGGGQHQHAEHAVGAVDQRQPLLLGQHDRLDARPPRAPRAAGISAPEATRTSPSPIAASAQCASGARSPEQPSDPYSCTTGVMPAVEHPRVGLGGRQPDAGPAGGQRRQPQQHHRPGDLGLHLGSGPGGVRADQGALQLRAALGRDLLGGQRPEPGRHAVVRRAVVREVLDDLAAGDDLGLRLGEIVTAAPFLATATTSAKLSGPVPTMTVFTPL